MSRLKKDGKFVNVYMAKEAYDKLNEGCKKTGLSKTAYIERAIMLYSKKKQD